MNSKFFDVKKDKQDSIINAALKIFSLKGYKDASTDVIVKEAGISKGLLFHYFTSKQGLYDFICDYSTKYMTLELTRSVRKGEKDFFEVMSQLSAGRASVMKNYPYMQQFLRSIRHETDPEALAVVGSSISDMETTYRNIYNQVNTSKLVNPEAFDKIIDIMDWMNDGFIKDRFNDDSEDPDKLFEEYAEYLTLLRAHFYKRTEDVKVSIAKEEYNERNEAVMDELKMEMTFEERLEAGRRPLVRFPEFEAVRDFGEASNADDTDKSTERSADLDEEIAKTATYGAPLLNAVPKRSSVLSSSDSDSSSPAQSIDDIIKEAEQNIQEAEQNIQEAEQSTSESKAEPEPENTPDDSQE